MELSSINLQDSYLTCVAWIISSLCAWNKVTHMYSTIVWYIVGVHQHVQKILNATHNLIECSKDLCGITRTCLFILTNVGGMFCSPSLRYLSSHETNPVIKSCISWGDGSLGAMPTLSWVLFYPHSGYQPAVTWAMYSILPTKSVFICTKSTVCPKMYFMRFNVHFPFDFAHAKFYKILVQLSAK